MSLKFFKFLTRTAQSFMPVNSVAEQKVGRAKSNPSHQQAPVRMAYLVSRYPAVSHTFILREVQQLSAQNFEIHVASINPPDRSEAEMSADERTASAATYYVKQHGLVGALAAHLFGLCYPANYFRGLIYALKLGGYNLKLQGWTFAYFTEALMLARWMKARQLTHLHVHFATAAANVGLVLKHTFPIGLSLTVHGPDEFYDASGQWLQQKISAADFIVCIGNFARSQLMLLSSAKHWHKFEICPLGIDPEHYLPQAKLPSEAPFTILCVGRLTPAKGQRILIDTCHTLLLAKKDFRLVIVGAGPDEAELKAAVAHYGLQDWTEFTGPLNQIEVRQRYAAADVFALPSFAEGIPVVLMEAMASGIPCITTRITGIPELIRDGEDGLLVTPSDEQELAAALIKLMDHPELRERLAQSARHRVSEKYNLQRNVARLAHVFQHRLEVA